MQLEEPQEFGILGHEQRHGQRQQLPALDEHVRGWVGLAVVEQRRRGRAGRSGHAVAAAASASGASVMAGRSGRHRLRGADGRRRGQRGVAREQRLCGAQ